MRKRTLVSEHPIVRVHPETGERALYVSPSFLKSILGMSPRESQVLLGISCGRQYPYGPNITAALYFRWSPGSVAFRRITGAHRRNARRHAPPGGGILFDFRDSSRRASLPNPCQRWYGEMCRSAAIDGTAF
jgi:hypothetical protein